MCVKRALPKLRVGSDWYAPVSRNRYEWEWLRLAAPIVPQSVPQPLAHDPELGLFAMAFLPGDRYPLWKRQLLDGKIDVDTAARVGRLLATLHNATAGRPEVAAAFDTTTTSSRCGWTRTCWPPPCGIPTCSPRSPRWSSARRRPGSRWFTAT